MWETMPLNMSELKKPRTAAEQAQGRNTLNIAHPADMFRKATWQSVLLAGTFQHDLKEIEARKQKTATNDHIIPIA